MSVILPTRDRLPLLRQAVGSVREQTFGAWELVVVDHGSRDGSRAFLEGLADPRIRVLSRPRARNPAELRNEGIEAARGRHVAFLDSDDLWAPRKLERHLERMAASTPTGEGTREVPDRPWRWSYSAVERIDVAGRPAPGRGIRPWRALSGRILRELLAMEAILATPAVVAERELVREAGGFDPSLPYCEDYDLWFRLADRAEVLALPEPLARVRVHASNYSSDRAAVHACWRRVYAKAAGATDDRALLRLCRQREREHSLVLASLLADAGDGEAALRELRWLLPRAPASLRAWHVLARALLAAGTRGGTDPGS